MYSKPPEHFTLFMTVAFHQCVIKYKNLPRTKSYKAISENGQKARYSIKIFIIFSLAQACCTVAELFTRTC